MTPEPNQSRGPDSREASACPDAASPDLAPQAVGRPNPLCDFLANAWRLPDALELPRLSGSVATRATLLATARQREATGEFAAASAAFTAFARACWAIGVDYAEAIRAALRALELHDDVTLRLELADRLEEIGAHSASARILEERTGEVEMGDLVATRRRLASLAHRTGDAEAAAAQFSELARVGSDATSALASIGTLAGWAPEQVSRERGVVAWHEAARRHKAQGALLAAFEATHRAFELEPASSLAAERLARELEVLGRREAADEVWRQSAAAAGDDARHDMRVVAALDAGDLIGALVAMLDGRSDCNFDMSQLVSSVAQLLSPNRGIARSFDLVLAELGCADWLAVRLEAGPLLERWTDEADCHVALSRLEANYFVHKEAAREALVRAIIVLPGHPEARARLSSWGDGEETTDLLLRGLVQSARAAQGGLLARQLAGEVLDRGRNDPKLASLNLWAIERLQPSLHPNDGLRTQRSVWLDAVAQQQVQWSELQSKWAEIADTAHIDVLRTVESQLAVDPTRTIDHLTVVLALVEIEPKNGFYRSLYAELLDLVARLVISPSRDERLLRALVHAPRLLGERGRIAQAKFYLRHGQIEQALAALLPVLEDSSPSIRGLLWLFTLARRFRDALLSARALERIATGFRPAIRGVLEAVVADLYLDAHAPDDAFRMVSTASRTGQNLPRLVTLEAMLADYSDLPVNTDNIERALSKVLASSQLCRVLSSAHLSAAEPDVALAWIHRALSLRPGDVDLRNSFVRLALDVGDPARVNDVLNDLMTQALPIAAWIESAASALAWLTCIDVERALRIAKQLLGFAGASNRSLRAAMLDVARVAGDESFAVEVLERASAISSDSAAIHLALAERRFDRGEMEAGTAAALRAARAGAPFADWQRFLSKQAADASPDAALGQLELECLASTQDGSGVDRTQAWRALAVARFDLAQDVDGAVDAWRALAESAPERDWGPIARDMGETLGKNAASIRLLELGRSLVDSSEQVKVFALAAQLCFEAGDSETALSIVGQAAGIDFRAMGLLPFAERVSEASDLADRLETLYQSLEHTVLGGFAERSLHYRAARGFERLGQWNLAMRHALQAFEAKPDDMAIWRTFVRISRSANEPQAMAQAAMRVAEASSVRESAHLWLARAFEQLSDSQDELRLKFDLAIRMLVGLPQVSGVHRVARCIRNMQTIGVEEVDFMRMRFERAIESLIAELEGPDGSRLGIAICEVATAELNRPDIAAPALLSALKADADLEEFSSLLPVMLKSAPAAREAIGPSLQRCVEWLERPYVQIGEEAIRLLVTLGVVLDEAPLAARILMAARKHGHEDALHRWTREELIEQLFDARDGRRGAIALAAAYSTVGDLEPALQLLDRSAQIWARQWPDSGEPSALDAIWNGFCEQYGTIADAVPMPEGLLTLRERVSGLERCVPAAIVAALRVRIERRGSDGRALCAALAELAFVGTGTHGSRAELLVEAAAVAQALGEFESALIYLRAAVGMQRTSAVARLGLATLMVRMGRHRNPEQAQVLLDITAGLESSIPEEQRDTAVFLRAEALDALGMEADAQRLLEDAESRIGPRPLIVLGLAEHAVRLQMPTLSLGYFAAALGGNLRDLRSYSSVSLMAARAAAEACDVSLALQWLSPALEDSTTRPDALVLEAELQGAADAAAERSQFVTSSAGISAKVAIEMPGATPNLTSDHSRPVDSSITPTAPLDAGQFGQTSRISASPDFEQPASWSSDDETNPSGIPAPLPTASDARIAAEEGSTNWVSRDASGAGAGGPPPSIIQILEPTALEMAVLLGQQAAVEPDQLRAWLPDGKRQLRQWPLAIQLVELVQEAARLEAHTSLVNALSHVASVLRGEAVVPEPVELAGQSVDIDAVRSLLMRDLGTPELEALALVWDGAEHEFLSETSDYEITGVMRVVGTASALARAYAEIARHFGIPRTPLFHKRTPEPLSIRVALLSPTAALLEGDAGIDESTVGYRVGCALWATIPEHSLLFGASRERVIAVLRAMVLAFGSTNGQPNPTLGESLRMAQVLWQTVRSRSQRRLKEICTAELDVGRALATANQSLRRAGLYACGNLRTALGAAGADLEIDAEHFRECRWDEVCRLAPDLLDLFRFAACAEYADVRWQMGRPAQFGGWGT